MCLAHSVGENRTLIGPGTALDHYGVKCVEFFSSWALSSPRPACPGSAPGLSPYCLDTSKEWQQDQMQPPASVKAGG